MLVRLNGRGVPANAILFSSIVGFACVIAAAFAEDTIFAFLLNSSGAIILFVYILIAISQIVLRYRNANGELRLKMWLFPVLSILTTVAMLAILVQMYFDDKLRSQLLLSLLSWAVVLGFFLVGKKIQRRQAASESGVLGDDDHRHVYAGQNSGGRRAEEDSARGRETTRPDD